MDSETLAHSARIGQITLVYATCLSSILWYDTLSTLPRELKLVWIPLYQKLFTKKSKSQDLFTSSKNSSSPLSYISIGLFFTVRWLCNVQFILVVWSIWRIWTPEACQKFFYVDSYPSAIVTSCATAIMSLRLSAIWGRNPKIDFLMFTLWLTLSACLLWGAYFITPVKGVTYCIAQQSGGNNLLALYIGPMIFDAIVLVLTISRAIQLNYGISGSIIKVLIRDGILYFLGTFTVNLLATVFELQNLDPALKPMNATLATVGTSIFSSRIFFRMRELAKPVNRSPSGGVVIPATFADGTHSNGDSQLKSGISRETDGSKKTRWSGIASNFSLNRKQLSGSMGMSLGNRVFNGKGLGNSRGDKHLTAHSIQVQREVDVEMGSFPSSDNQTQPSFSSNSRINKGKGMNSDEEDDDDQFSLTRISLSGNGNEISKGDSSTNSPLQRTISRKSVPRDSLSSSQEIMRSSLPSGKPNTSLSQQSRQSQSSQFSDHGHQVSIPNNSLNWDSDPFSKKIPDLRRFSNGSDLPPFTRQPSRDGPEGSQFGDSSSSHGSRGPRITTPNSLKASPNLSR